MKKHRMAKADFIKVADNLASEAFTGGIHLDICEGLTEMDPFIENYAPVFFMYSFYGNLYAAQMYAIKLFDTHADAFTIPKFLQMAAGTQLNCRRGSMKIVIDGKFCLACPSSL